MELFKTVPEYSWLFIYFRKYWNLSNIKLIEKLSRRHLINSSDVFIFKGFTVKEKKHVKKPYTNVS